MSPTADGESNDLGTEDNSAVQAVMSIVQDATEEIRSQRGVFSTTPSEVKEKDHPKNFGDEDETKTVELLAEKLAFVSERVLDLSGKGLQRLTASTVSRLTHLVRLNLSLNPLKDLPDLAPMCSLRELHINACNFTALPEGVGSLRHLEILSAEGCGMKDLPSNSLPPLIKILVLSKNSIRTLPMAFNHRPIEKVLLNDNQLEDVQNLSGTTTLEYLNLERNLITKVPEGILKLPKLSCLGLAGNQLVLETDISKSPQSNEKMALVAAAGKHPGLRSATSESLEAIEVEDLAGRKPLGSVPTLDKTKGELLVSLAPASAVLAMKTVAEAMTQAHSSGVAHGELIAQRVFVDPEHPESAQVEIFAKGFKYPGACWLGSPFECIEVRAWGELFLTLLGDYDASRTSCYEEKGLRAWKAIVADCLRHDPKSRPRFAEVVERLTASFEVPASSTQDSG